MNQQVTLTVFGRVQHVGFRAFCVHYANQFGLNGYCKNQKHDNVLVVAQGEKEKIDGFLKIILAGTPWIRIERSEESWTTNFEPLKGFTRR